MEIGDVWHEIPGTTPIPKPPYGFSSEAGNRGSSTFDINDANRLASDPNALRYFEGNATALADYRSKMSEINSVYHHGVPREHFDFWKNRDLDFLERNPAMRNFDVHVKEFGVVLSPDMHQKLHAEGWNSDWKSWIAGMEQRKIPITPDAVRDRLNEMKGLPKYKAIWNSGIAPNKNYLSYGLPSNKAVRTTNTETLRKKGNVARNSRMGGGRGAVTLLFSAAAPVLFGMVISNDATGSEGQRPDAMLAESLTTLTGEEPGSGAHKEAYFVWAKAGLHDSGLPLAYPKWWEASLYDAYERLYASQKYQSYVSENGLENLSLIDLIDDSGKIRPEYAPHINAIKKMLDAIKGGR